MPRLSLPIKISGTSRATVCIKIHGSETDDVSITIDIGETKHDSSCPVEEEKIEPTLLKDVRSDHGDIFETLTNDFVDTEAIKDDQDLKNVTFRKIENDSFSVRCTQSKRTEHKELASSKLSRMTNDNIRNDDMENNSIEQDENREKDLMVVKNDENAKVDDTIAKNEDVEDNFGDDLFADMKLFKAELAALTWYSYSRTKAETKENLESKSNGKTPGKRPRTKSLPPVKSYKIGALPRIMTSWMKVKKGQENEVVGKKSDNGKGIGECSTPVDHENEDPNVRLLKSSKMKHPAREKSIWFSKFATKRKTRSGTL